MRYFDIFEEIVCKMNFNTYNTHSCYLFGDTRFIYFIFSVNFGSNNYVGRCNTSRSIKKELPNIDNTYTYILHNFVFLYNYFFTLDGV